MQNGKWRLGAPGDSGQSQHYNCVSQNSLRTTHHEHRYQPTDFGSWLTRLDGHKAQVATASTRR